MTVVQGFGNSNLESIGYEVFRHKNGVNAAAGSEAEGPASPEEAFLQAWLQEDTPRLSATSTPILTAPELASRYGYVAPMVSGDVLRMMNE